MRYSYLIKCIESNIKDLKYDSAKRILSLELFGQRLSIDPQTNKLYLNEIMVPLDEVGTMTISGIANRKMDELIVKAIAEMKAAPPSKAKARKG